MRTAELSLAEQKEKYEQRREQELKKRRELILGQHLKPIHTSYHLQEEEVAYYAFEAARFVDKEVTQSFTVGHTKQKNVIKRAIVGDLLFGRTGAVIGGLSGGSKTVSKTIHQRSTQSEEVDRGTMLVTNKRIVFIGRQTLSISYTDMLSYVCEDYTLQINYPAMLPGEHFSHYDENLQWYLQGLMRSIGRETGTLDDKALMRNYPSFKPATKERQKMHSVFTYVLVYGIIFAVITLFLRTIIVLFNYFVCILLGFAIIGYLAMLLDKFTTKQYPEDQQDLFKKFILWTIPIFLYGLIIAFL